MSYTTKKNYVFILFTLCLSVVVSVNTHAFALSFNDNLQHGFDSPVIKTITQPDGKVLVGGYFHNFNGDVRNALVRLNGDGTEDKNFYSNAADSLKNLGFVIDTDLQLQRDNKILVAGAFNLKVYDAGKYLTRLNSNGTEDVAFYKNLGTGFDDIIYSVKADPFDKIIVTGGFTSFNGKVRNGIVRLNSDGTEDVAFYEKTNFATSDIILQSIQKDGKMILSGSIMRTSRKLTAPLVRLNSDGTEDTTFSLNLGKSFVYGTDGGAVLRVAIQNDSKIIVTGGFTSFNGKVRNGIVRLNSDGTEDVAFYEKTSLGFIFNPYSSFVMYMQPNDQIIIGGNFTSFNGKVRNGIVRLNSDGTEDVAFYEKISPLTHDGDAVRSIEYTQNNKILLCIAGKNYWTAYEQIYLTFMRINANGSEDISGRITAPQKPPRTCLACRIPSDPSIPLPPTLPGTPYIPSPVSLTR